MLAARLPRGSKYWVVCIVLGLVVGCGKPAQQAPQSNNPTPLPGPNHPLGVFMADLTMMAVTVAFHSQTANSTTATPSVSPTMVEESATPTVMVALPPPAQPVELITPTLPVELVRQPSGRIAYVRTDDRVVGMYDIYTANPDGTDPQQLTNSPALDTEPDWSPDSQSIAFVSTLDSSDPGNCTSGYVEFRCNFDIYAMAANTPQAVPSRLTTSPNYDREPDWSPDGSQIAYASRETGAPFSFIVVMNADGSNQRALTASNSASDFSPHWSPDGTKIAFTRGDAETIQIWVMNADGSGAYQLISENALDGYHLYPSWSPDGTKIAFVQVKLDSSLGWIAVANADGTNPQIIPGPRTILGYSVAWSPDSSRILYVSEIEGIFGIYNLGVTDLSGQTIDAALLPPEAFFSAPDWSLGTQ